MSSLNTIQRQKAEPLLTNACHVMRHYGIATDTTTTVVDPDYNPVYITTVPAKPFFCSICKKYRREKTDPDEWPCAERHKKAISDSCRNGGLYIYLCDMGFLFWTSPFFCGEEFVGAAIGSGGLGITQQQFIEKITEISGGEVPREQIEQHLNAYAGKGYANAEAKARMMLICANQLSAGNLQTEHLFNERSDPLSSAVLKPSFKSKDTDNEVRLLASLRRGDREDANRTMRELLENNKAEQKPHTEDGETSPQPRNAEPPSEYAEGSFDALQMRAVELAAFISRAAADTKNSPLSAIPEEIDKYLVKIEGASSANEIYEIFEKIINLMAGKMFSFHGVLHSSALRKAERFIWKNYTRKISLKEIADAAGLSPPYFSTIFREEMGIHLSHYLNRLRVVKAASMLVETSKSISNIAEECGFEDQSWFSKIFKSHIGISPGKYREQRGICRSLGWIDLNIMPTEKIV